MEMSLKDLFAEGRVGTINGILEEYIGKTLSIEDNKVGMDELLQYTKENFCHARCVINDEWVYAHNGEAITILETEEPSQSQR